MPRKAAVQKIAAPPAMSKSLHAAMRCETYFAGYYLLDPAPAQPGSELMYTGSSFHDYRKRLIEHLIETGQDTDPTFVDRYLEAADLSEDAADLISRDRWYTINVANVYAAELFLSVDAEFEPLLHIRGADPGDQDLRSSEAHATGFLDLVILDGNTAIIEDAKSGWSSNTVKDYEPIHYAVLAFCHFPVERVVFRWDFVRSGATREVVFNREDAFGWMKRAIDAAQEEKRAIEEAFRAGRKMRHDPFAGLCPSCTLQCPARDLAKYAEIGAVQTADEARLVAAKILVAREGIKHLQAVLEPYLDEHGPLSLGAGEFVAELKPGYTTSYPLIETLKVLGVDNVPALGKYDMPLSKLTLSGMSGYAKAKCRAEQGAVEAIGSVGKRTARTELKIHRKEKEETA
jgi:hypothetical protein